MYAVNGILFNHESPVRGETFVSRKITRAVARIALGMQEKLFIGNLDAQRDWGHARDYVELMWLMLQQEKPEDFVIATGKTTSVRDFALMAFREAGMHISFQGSGLDEFALVTQCDDPALKWLVGKKVLVVDPLYFRPTEVDLLLGDAGKARKQLGWSPKHQLAELIREMVHADLALFGKDKYLKEGGHSITQTTE